MIPDKIMSFGQAGFQSRLQGKQSEGKPRANSCNLPSYTIILSLPETSDYYHKIISIYLSSLKNKKKNPWILVKHLQWKSMGPIC